MSYSNFVMCLVGYILLVVASFLVPDDGANAKVENQLGSYKKPRLIAVGIFNFAILGAGIIGFWGLFLLKATATYLFFSAVAVRIISDYVFGNELKMKGVRGALAHITVAVEFLLAGLIFFGPAGSLFHW